MLFAIRHRYGKVLHTVDVGDRRVEPYAPDLRGIDLSNLDLSGAQLSFSKLDRLLGANLQGSDLSSAKISGSIAYTNLAECDLSGSDLSEVTDAYPVAFDRHTRLESAKGINPGSELDYMRNEIVFTRRKHFR